MRSTLTLIFIALAFALPSAASALPRWLPYGAHAERQHHYTVRTTIFGCTSWDDNGIGFFGGVDLHRLKWGVAELGFRGGSMGTAMGGIPGGTIATVTNPVNGKRVRVVFADVGGGHNYYQLDLHCGVAAAIGLADTGVTTIVIHPRVIDLRSGRVDWRGLGPIPARRVR